MPATKRSAEGWGASRAALRSRLNRPLAPAEQATLEGRLAPAQQTLSAEEQATAWAARGRR